MYVPGIEFDGALPTAEPYFTIGPEFWKRPKNWRELLDAVAWAAKGDIPLQVDGPDFLAANLVEQPEKQRRLVHLVNYDPKKTPFIENIAVKCTVPEGKPATAVTLYSIDSDGGEAINFRMQGANAVFSIPRLNTYCIAVVSW